MPEAPLIVTTDGELRIVTMNLPERMNAISQELHAALTAVWGDLAHDRGARAVVLTGSGRAFSAGGDADWLERVATDPEVRWHAIEEGGQLFRAMLRCPLPMVAAVNGPAVGLGASIASLCDLIVMSEKSFFADPHVAIGIAAGDGAAATWPAIIGMPRAKELILLGDRIAPEEAVRIGMANRVASPDELMSVAGDLARRLGALPVYAMRATKRAMNLQIERSALGVIDYALASESEHFSLPGMADKIRAMRG